MKTVLMPKELTAENGAKACLIGEFFETIQIPCEECLVMGETDDDTCPECFGTNYINRRVPVSWTTTKDIYAAVVKHFGMLKGCTLPNKDRDYLK